MRKRTRCGGLESSESLNANVRGYSDWDLSRITKRYLVGSAAKRIEPESSICKELRAGVLKATI